jgi:hypothetical protein
MGMASGKMRGPAGMDMDGMPAPTPAEQAERLATVLQLRPAQQAAAQAFVGALDAARQQMIAAMPDGAPPQTTPERLALMQRMMAQHQSAMTQVIEATRRFYAQLDPAQQRAFDALSPMLMRHHMMMGAMGPPEGPGPHGPMGPPHR